MHYLACGILPAFRNYPNADENGKFDSDDVTHTLSLSVQCQIVHRSI